MLTLCLLGEWWLFVCQLRDDSLPTGERRLFAWQSSCDSLPVRWAVTLCLTVEWGLFVWQLSGDSLSECWVATLCLTVEWRLFVWLLSGDSLLVSWVSTPCPQVRDDVSYQLSCKKKFVGNTEFSKYKEPWSQNSKIQTKVCVTFVLKIFNRKLRKYRKQKSHSTSTKNTMTETFWRTT